MNLLRRLFSSARDKSSTPCVSPADTQPTRGPQARRPPRLVSPEATAIDVPQLMTALASGDKKARLSAVKELRKAGDPRTIPVLIDALKDTEKTIRQGAVAALSKCGPPALEPLLKALTAPDKYSRLGAAGALMFLDSGLPTVAYHRDTHAVELLIAALSDDDKDVRYNVALALGMMRDLRAVEPLIEALSTTDLSAAATALGMLGDPRAMAALIAALQSHNEYTRRSAAKSLGVLGDSRAIPPLTVALSDACEGVRQDATEALANLQKQGHSSVVARGAHDGDTITLEQVLKVIRKEPAGSKLVETTCHLLVLQVMCGKIDADKAGYTLRQIMGERDPGQNVLSNAARAIGALSAIGK